MNKTWYLRLLLKILLGMVVLYALYLVWAVIAFGGGCKRMQGEIHYIPAGYIGKVYIIFDEREGAEKEYLGNRRVYRIPRSGILRTKFDVNLGWINSDKDQHFYYWTPNDKVKLYKLISIEDFEADLDSCDITIIEYGFGANLLDFDLDKGITSYMVDSFKNYNKRDYMLTREMYERWLE